MTREFISLAEVKKLLAMVAMLSAAACCAQVGVPEADLRVDLTKPALWTVDTVHLGNHQLTLRADATEPTLTIEPLWTAQDRSSEIKGIRRKNILRLWN